MLKLQSSLKTIILIMFTILTLITDSKIYLILSTFIILYIIFIKLKNVKFIIYYTKISVPWLIFIVLLYIILIGKYSSILILIYKLLLIIISHIIFISISDFEELNKGINKILSPLAKLNINFYEFSYNLALSLYFIKSLFEISKKTKKSYKENVNKKERILVNFILANRKMQEYDEVLKLKFYNKKNQDKWTKKEKIILIVASVIFVIVLIRK